MIYEDVEEGGPVKSNALKAFVSINSARAKLIVDLLHLGWRRQKLTVSRNLTHNKQENTHMASGQVETETPPLAHRTACSQIQRLGICKVHHHTFHRHGELYCVPMDPSGGACATFAKSSARPISSSILHVRAQIITPAPISLN